MLKLIIFDWDGTIANSIPKIMECKDFLAKKYNLPIPDDTISQKVIGMQFKDALITCFPTASSALLKIIGNEFHELMQLDQYQSELFPGAFDTLNKLKQQLLKITVSTSKSRTGLDAALRFHKLNTIFDATCCGHEHAEKPNPAMLHYLLKKFGVRPCECLVVGDTTIDIQFANNAHIESIAVTFGAHSKSELELANPIALAEDWAQLFGEIKKLC